MRHTPLLQLGSCHFAYLKRIAVVLFLLSGADRSAFAQVQPLSTEGRTFWAGFMQNAYGAQNLRIQISSRTSTSGIVSIPLSGWSQAYTVSANGSTIVNVPITAEHTGSEAISPKGVLITAVDRVWVRAFSQQSFTTDMSLVLPVEALGTDYVAMGYRGLPGFGDFYKSELLIVATEDDTQVSITPSVNTAGGRPAGVPFTIDLDAGESYQVQSSLASLSISGTTITGTAQSGPCRPFAVFSGSMCANVPVGCPACDHLFEQMYPTATWGNTFRTVNINGTTGNSYLILARQNGTTATINGGTSVPLSAGQVHEVNGNGQPVCITSNLPIAVAQVMEGYNCAGAGDPSMIMVEPEGRSSTYAVYSTPAATQVNQHGLSLVVPAAAIGQITLDGAIISPAQFTPYAACPSYSYASMSVTPGTHTIQSALGFTAYASGIGTGESYAFPLGSTAPETILPDSLICSTGPLTLSVPVPLNNITWTAASDPNTVISTAASINFVPAQADTIHVEGVIGLSSCPMSFMYIIGAPMQSNFTLSANGQGNLTACQFTPIQLNASPAPDPNFFDLWWTPSGLVSDPTIANPQAFPTNNTWFKLEVTSPVGCGLAKDSILVNVTPANVTSFDAIATDTVLCVGESVPLTCRVESVVASDLLDGPAGVLWNGIQNGTISAACGSMSGTALYFNGNGARNARTDPFNMPNGGTVHFALKIASGVSPCDDADPGEDVVLEYSTNGSTYFPLATFDEAMYPAFTQVSVPVPALMNIQFRWRQLAHSGNGQDNWALDNIHIASVDGSALGYSWSPAAVMASPNMMSTQASPSASGWYHVSASDPNSLCTYSDSVYLDVHPAFDLTVTNDTAICDVAGVQLNAIPSSGMGITYSWTPNNGSLSATNIADPMAMPASMVTYTVAATNNIGCTAQDSVAISVGQLIGLDLLASDTILCEGANSQLNANVQGTPNTVLTWIPATGLSSTLIPDPLATPLMTTTYIATLTDTASACTVVDSVTLIVIPTYSLVLSADTTVCSSLGLQLQAQHNVNSPASINWSPASLLSAPNTIAPTLLFDTTATYAVSISDVHGCSVTDSVTITDAFDDLVTPSQSAACDGQSIQLDAGYPGSTYAWSHGPLTQLISVDSTGTYSVQITDPQGCQATRTYFATIHPLPYIDLGPDLELCGQPSVVLNANSLGNNIIWSTSASGQSLTVTQNGSYTATATSAFGCVSSDSVTVAFNALPVDILQDTITCTSMPPTLDAGNAGSTFLWSTLENTQMITASASGTYTVTVTSPQDCSSTFDAVVLLVPDPVVDLGPDLAQCANVPLSLDAENPGSSYLWNTSATTQTISPTSSGTYSVTVNNGACSVSDSITVTINPLPTNGLQDITTCVDQTVLLDAGNAGSSYLWNTGATGMSISPTASGTYSVTVTTQDNCVDTFSSVLLFVDFPIVDIGPDTVLCEGDVLILDAANTGAQFAWSNGQNTESIQVTSSGTYSVAVNNGHCTTTDAMTAVFNPSPARLAVNQVYTCLEEDPHFVVIDAGNPGSAFNWSTGEHTQVILAGAYGWYYVDVVNNYNCDMRDSLVVDEFCPANLYVPNTFSPNADGVNDIWMPVARNLANIEVSVFDRGGVVIFRTNVIGEGWDGKMSGETVMNDLYIWKITYRFFEDANGQLGPQREQMGHVQVLR